MINPRSFAVNRYRGANGDPSKDFIDGLHPQTNPQNRNDRGKVPDHRLADTGMRRVFRPGRDADPIRVQLFEGRKCDLIVPVDQDLQVKLIEELHQVVGKRIIIINHDDPHGPLQKKSHPDSLSLDGLRLT